MQSFKTRFEVLESEEAVLVAVSLPIFRLRWLQTQEQKDKGKAHLLAECPKTFTEGDQQSGSNTHSQYLRRSS